MSIPKFFRLKLSSELLFPKENNPSLEIRTELKMFEELIRSAHCTFEPALEEEHTNALLSYVPVRVYFNRSVNAAHMSLMGMAMKAEKMSEHNKYVLDTVTIDCLIPFEENANLRELCLEHACEQLNEYRDRLIESPDIALEPMHFATESKKIISMLVPSEANELQKINSVNQRLKIDGELVYVDILSSRWSVEPGSHLINPHEFLPPLEDADQANQKGSPGKASTVEIAITPGYYRYFRYNEDGMADSGWGCAYRSLQTVCSWFRMQGYTDKAEPTHRIIQNVLIDIGDKPKTFIGSAKWIGSLEVGYVLENYLGIKSRILSVNSGDEMDTLASQLIQHFRTNGAPVMIGGGVLAHTIAGVYLNRATGSVKFLILDPHYNSASKANIKEEVKAVIKAGAVGWKDMSFWKKGEFYNLCLPQRPSH